MDDPRKHQVSLRGASAKEITRNALLERVSHERELRNFARRANAAALFIQRVWRRYNVTKRVALVLKQEWSLLLNKTSGLMMKTCISCSVLRPFLFFITRISSRRCIIHPQTINCMRSCFIILLENINSTDPDRNYCSLAIGTVEEQRMWSYQVQKLVSLCSFILADYDNNSFGNTDIVAVTSLLMRVVFILTDWKGWKCITDEHCVDADRAVKDIIKFIGSDKSGLYRSIGRYMNKLNTPVTSLGAVQKDDMFLITASAITLALRPFQAFNSAEKDVCFSMQCAAEEYCLFILTVPWLVQHIPSVLLRALRHKSILIPCFKTILVMADLK